MEEKFSIASYLAAAWSALFGAMTAQAWGVVIGGVLGAATLAVNWWYKRAMLRLAERQADRQ